MMIFLYKHQYINVKSQRKDLNECERKPSNENPDSICEISSIESALFYISHLGIFLKKFSIIFFVCVCV